MQEKDEHKIPLPESTGGKIAYFALLIGTAIIADKPKARGERKRVEERRVQEAAEEAKRFRIDATKPYRESSNELRTVPAGLPPLKRGKMGLRWWRYVLILSQTKRYLDDR